MAACTPSHCTGHISSFCSGGDCVVVHRTRSGNIRVASTRSSEARRAVTYTPDEWAAFIAGAKAGEFDLDRLA